MVIKVHGKKLRKYKDPLNLLETKRRKNKDKTNDPPKNADDQKGKMLCMNYIPKVEDKPDHYQKKRRFDTADFLTKDTGYYPKNGRPLKQIPTVKQKRRESFYNFFQRVKRTTDDVVKESQFQMKYEVQVERDIHGEISGYKSWKEIDAETGNKKLQKAIEERKNKIRLKRKERELKKKLRKQKKHLNKLKRKDDESDFDEDGEEKPRKKKLFVKENIEFGVVVHEPPVLNTEAMDKRCKDINKMKKCRNFLFLQNLNESKDSEDSKSTDVEKSKKDRQKMLEAERERAVFAYRQIKANKQDKYLI